MRREPMRVFAIGGHPEYIGRLHAAVHQVHARADDGTHRVLLTCFDDPGIPLSIINMVRPDAVIVWAEQPGTSCRAVAQQIRAAVNGRFGTALIGTHDDRIPSCGIGCWNGLLQSDWLRLERASEESDYYRIAQSLAASHVNA